VSFKLLYFELWKALVDFTPVSLRSSDSVSMRGLNILLSLPAGSIMTDRETGKPRGFGFVEFYDIPTAESAIRNLSGKDFKGRNIRCGGMQPPCNICLPGLRM
jgi:hypothetical protein